MRRLVRRTLEDFTLAMSFMTRLPVPALAILPSRRAAEALWAMPLAGLIVGSACGAVWICGLWLGLGSEIASIVALAVLAALTGAIHDDGFADFWDGMGSSGSKEHRIEVMRDPRIGTFGSLALILLYLVLVNTVSEIASAKGAEAPGALVLDHIGLMGILAAAAMQARAAVTIPYFLLGPAGKDGLAHTFGKPAPAQLLLTIIWPIIVSVGVFAWLGLAMILGAIAGGLVITVLAWRQIGGYTGDVLGASIMTSFAGALLAVRVLVE
ncbi:MAG: adenosylcobinamide-GDP ribazoletransferase [Hyphomicrobiaceae bacterium]